MKKFVKLAAPVAFLLTLVAFILLLATPGVTAKGNIAGSEGSIDGTLILFGDKNFDLVAVSLVGWILALVSMLVLCAASVGDLLKVKPLQKYAKLLTLGSIVPLLVAGILVFCTITSFKDGLFSYALGAGWIIAGILLILAGLVAALPLVATLLGKDK